MKTFRIFFISMALLLTISCQPDVEKEKEAIMDVLRQESDALISADFDSFKALHLQDELETRVEMGIFGYNVFKGWDRVSTLVEDFMEHRSMENLTNKKENCIVNVSGKSAWATCDNLWFRSSAPDEIVDNNLQIVFLEKVNGSWKISFSAYYLKGDINEMTDH